MKSDVAPQGKNMPDEKETDTVFSYGTGPVYNDPDGNFTIEFPSGFGLEEDQPDYQFIAWWPAATDKEEAPYCIFLSKNDLSRELSDEMSLDDYETVFHQMQQLMAKAGRGMPWGIYRGHGEEPTILGATQLDDVFYIELPIGPKRTTTIKARLALENLNAKEFPEILQKFVDHIRVHNLIAEHPADRENTGDPAMEEASNNEPVWGKRLTFTQNRHVNGLDFSIGVPDGFVVQEDVEDSALGMREFIIYWPDPENPDDVMDSPLAMFAQPQYQSSEKPVSRENWQYIARQFAEQFARMGMAHDIFSNELENVSYVAYKMSRGTTMIIHTVTPYHNFSLRITAGNDQADRAFTKEALDSWMSTICPVAEDREEEKGSEETKLPENTQQETIPKESAKKEKPAPKTRKSRRKPFEIRGTLVPLEECTLDERGFLTGLRCYEDEIILPVGIKGIEKDAFLYTTKKNSVVVPQGATTLAESAFQSCYGVRYVFLPTTLRTIGNKAFFCCNRMTSILVPEGCTEIGTEAFCGCEKLKNIYLPASLQKIGKDAFRTWNSETTIHAPGGSVAEAYARENGLKVDNKPAPTITVASGVVLPSAAAPMQDEPETPEEDARSVEAPLAAETEPPVEAQPSAELQPSPEPPPSEKTIADEKKEEKARLQEQLQTLEQPSASEKEKQQRLAQLQTERNACGLFQFSKKKALDHQIHAAEFELHVLQKQRDAEREEVTEQIRRLTREIEE